MRKTTNQAISETVLAMCNDCRLQAAKVIIWNADISEIEEIIQEAENYLPALLDNQAVTRKIRSLINTLDHQQIRAIRAYLSLVLESPCKTEECQEACNESE